MEVAIVVVLLVILHGSLMVLFLTWPKSASLSRWFYLPSFLIVWLVYGFYEFIYLPKHCSGECNIRVDLLILYPYLAFVSICAIAYAFKRKTKDSPTPYDS